MLLSVIPRKLGVHHLAIHGDGDQRAYSVVNTVRMEGSVLSTAWKDHGKLAAFSLKRTASPPPAFPGTSTIRRARTISACGALHPSQQCRQSHVRSPSSCQSRRNVNVRAIVWSMTWNASKRFCSGAMGEKVAPIHCESLVGALSACLEATGPKCKWTRPALASAAHATHELFVRSEAWAAELLRTPKLAMASPKLRPHREARSLSRGTAVCKAAALKIVDGEPTKIDDVGLRAEMSPTVVRDVATLACSEMDDALYRFHQCKWSVAKGVRLGTRASLPLWESSLSIFECAPTRHAAIASLTFARSIWADRFAVGELLCADHPRDLGAGALLCESELGFIVSCSGPRLLPPPCLPILRC